MPNYNYTCQKCDNTFDRYLPMYEYKKDIYCGLCDSLCKKNFTAPGIARYTGKVPKYYDPKGNPILPKGKEKFMDMKKEVS